MLIDNGYYEEEEIQPEPTVTSTPSETPEPTVISEPTEAPDLTEAPEPTKKPTLLKRAK